MIKVEVVGKNGFEPSKSNVEYAEKKLQKLEQKIEILQRVNCTVSAPLQEKLQELAKLHGQYSVHTLCEAL